MAYAPGPIKLSEVSGISPGVFRTFHRYGHFSCTLCNVVLQELPEHSLAVKPEQEGVLLAACIFSPVWQESCNIAYLL